MKIKYLDLCYQQSLIKEEIDSVLNEVITKAEYINGFYKNLFEKEFANYLGIKYCIGCANGTDALEIALQSLSINSEEEVIVPAHSWISTSEAVNNIGAKPIFVDTLSDYYTIDTNKIRDSISKKTKAIIVVHLFGLPVFLEEIKKIAEEYNLRIIEDCAQAHGAEYCKKKVGCFGDIATFSFFPSKNLGAFGDAGCIVTNDNNLALRCKMLANHGQIEKHKHKIIGRNSRLDNIQAAILYIKLKYLDKWNDERIKLANYYNSLIKSNKIKLPKSYQNAKHVYHVYSIQAEKKIELSRYLLENGIETNFHYPTPLPFIEAYYHMKLKEKDFPVVSDYINRQISLPLYPGLSLGDVEYISNTINKFYSI